MISRYGTLTKAWNHLLKHRPSREMATVTVKKSGTALPMYTFIDLLDQMDFPGDARKVYKLVTESARALRAATEVSSY